MDIAQEKNQRVDLLKTRTKRCVCKYCGGNLDLKYVAFSEAIDIRAEIYCPRCAKIEFGVEREIYTSARSFVQATGFNCFPDKDDNEITHRMTIGKVCEIIDWHDTNVGLLDENGYRVTLDEGSQLYKNDLFLTNEDISAMLELDDGV